VARSNSSLSPPDRSRQLAKWVLAVVFAAVGAGIAYGWTSHARGNAAGDSQDDQTSAAGGGSGEAQKLKVKVVHPRKGGITRTTTQPGVLHAFQYADLYAKASGFLIAQAVDIGDTVERGQELAEIYDPEREQQVEQAAAAVQQGQAEVEQSLARVKTAEAMVESAKAFVEEKQAQVATYAAARKYHRKEYLRYIELTQQKAIDQRVSDEKEKQYESALAAEQEAEAAVKTAQADLTKAQAEVTTAKANVTAARAKVQVLEAAETQAEILVQYLKLTSPYDGVVTNRNYHRGDFIRSADQGSQPPVLSVARTDRIRVVVYIPDRDVPFLDRGDEAVVRVDALSGEEFRGKVSRYSAYEDPANRTMRAEIDLPNPTGRLREGMYGGVTILLEPPSDSLLLPSSALHKESESGEGELFVVQGGHARRRKVKLGRDNGIVVEVTGGLTTKELVVVSYSGSLEDDEPVDAGPVDEKAP
jgi:RND family efflux transporter MFP subunit